MAKRFDWRAIRDAWELGASFAELSRRYGCSKTAIEKRAKKDKWVRDVTGTVKRLAERKVAEKLSKAGESASALDFADRDVMVEAMAEQRALVIHRHRQAWPPIKAVAVEAGEERDGAKARLARTLAETERIIQEGERKAWGISDQADVQVAGSIELRWQQ